jgi:DNA-binding winged helix-turn-helix (wHTH) protein
MADVWVYAQSKANVQDVSFALAELGFAPHYVGPGESPVPTALEGSTLRRPSLAAVVAGPGEPLPSELFDRISAAEELDDVGLLLVVEPEHLQSYPGLATAYELLVRPFSIPELEVRVARATQDFVTSDDSSVVRAGSLELNLATYQVTIEGTSVGFAYMEYELLKFLMTHPNRVYSREALLTRVWGYDYYGGARTVDVHIRRVRAKLGQEQASRIKTVRSVGYLFDLPRAAQTAA